MKKKKSNIKFQNVEAPNFKRVCPNFAKYAG